MIERRKFAKNKNFQKSIKKNTINDSIEIESYISDEEVGIDRSSLHKMSLHMDKIDKDERSDGKPDLTSEQEEYLQEKLKETYYLKINEDFYSLAYYGYYLDSD